MIKDVESMVKIKTYMQPLKITALQLYMEKFAIKHSRRSTGLLCLHHAYYVYNACTKPTMLIYNHPSTTVIVTKHKQLCSFFFCKVSTTLNLHNE